MNPDQTRAARDVVGLYTRRGLDWERGRGRSLFEKPWLDRLLAHNRPRRRAALDLGCAGGDPLAGYLIAQGLRVTGVDASPPLLELARGRFPAHEWLLADMRGLNLGRTFDAVLAWDSFFHLTPDDQRAMFAVFARHASPGASLLFTSGPARGVAMGEIEGEPLFHASLDPDEYRALLNRHGFTVLAHKAEDPECGRHTIWLARKT